MAGVKGRSGTNKGKDKPFAEALRMELAAAGDNHKALRKIARNLITLAQDQSKDAMPAIKEIADRLDGKPAQEAMVTIDDKRDVTDWTREELVRFLRDAGNGGDGTLAEDGRDGTPDSVH
jgi:NADPH-dependent ferric siderophore reductase